MYFFHPENVRALPNDGVLQMWVLDSTGKTEADYCKQKNKDSKWQSPEDDANVVGLSAGKIEMRKKDKSFFKSLIW